MERRSTRNKRAPARTQLRRAGFWLGGHAPEPASAPRCLCSGRPAILRFFALCFARAVPSFPCIFPDRPRAGRATIAAHHAAHLWMGRGAAIRRHAAPRFTEVWRHGQKCAGLAEMSTNKNTARGAAQNAPEGARREKASGNGVGEIGFHHRDENTILPPRAPGPGACGCWDS